MAGGSRSSLLDDSTGNGTVYCIGEIVMDMLCLRDSCHPGLLLGGRLYEVIVNSGGPGEHEQNGGATMHYHTVHGKQVRKLATGQAASNLTKATPVATATCV